MDQKANPAVEVRIFWDDVDVYIISMAEGHIWAKS